MNRDFSGGGITRGGGNRESLDLKRGGRAGGSGGSVGAGSGGPGSGGASVSESKVSSGTKGKTYYSHKGGNGGATIETRNRFAALDDS